MSGFNLGDYVDVKERLQEFYKAFPTGSIQFEYRGVMDHNHLYIWGVAYAYRTPDDVRPGIGTAAELAEGKTTYTRGSELMNLETSAWGRAIGALGIGLGKSIATKQEVENAQARQEPETEAWGVPTDRIPLPDTSKALTGGNYGLKEMTEKQYGLIKSLFNYSFSAMTAYVDEYKARLGISPDEKLDSYNASKLIEELKAAGYVAGKKPNNPDPESAWN
jgi:hypothetical protein